MERVLVPGGLVVIADEVRPQGRVMRWLHAGLRFPTAGLAYLVTGQSSVPLVGLECELEVAGLLTVMKRRLGPTFAVYSAKKQEVEAR